MAKHPSDRSTGRGRSSSSRRDFFQQAAGVAAGIAALPSAETAAESSATAETLPTIQLGTHRVTRLIIGGNPI